MVCPYPVPPSFVDSYHLDLSVSGFELVLLHNYSLLLSLGSLVRAGSSTSSDMTLLLHVTVRIKLRLWIDPRSTNELGLSNLCSQAEVRHDIDLNTTLGRTPIDTPTPAHTYLTYATTSASVSACFL